MTKKKRAARSCGEPWTDEEVRLVHALRSLGAKGRTVVDAVNKHFNRTGTAARSTGALWHMLAAKEAPTVSRADKELAQQLLAGTFPRETSQAVEVREDPAPRLSPKFRKALEDKLAVHRFKIETPDAHVEVAVSGKNATETFKRIVAAIPAMG